MDLFSMGIGFVAALVVIQFFPGVARVGAWIVTKAKSIGK